jgi:hypothetical protein
MTLDMPNASTFSGVSRTSTFAIPDSRNAAPTVTITVDAPRAPRTAAPISTAPTTREITDSSPLEESPRT